MAAAGSCSLPLLLAALCILISTAFAGNANGNGNAPTVTEIISNEDVQQALGKAWKESFNSISNSNTQRGGWIYADSNYPDDHKYLLVQHATKQRSQHQGVADADGHIQLDNPEKEGAPSSEHYKLVADFHTHPNSHDDNQRPDSDDIKRAYERGVPGILVSCSGIFYYGPQRRASLDGPNGYPLSSPESYNGQKDVRFADNKFAPQANCNP
ncbi:hypothetical protein KI387_041902 [Taxus chinensis]|uniref:JAB domain-containing protein n=1 Tax=Taxus chinensis TaxID=29808 RepID=A0AA38F7U2_TAXCH|nr:hypothetical protein KI387_041902 [Taxus chinensis]